MGFRLLFCWNNLSIFWIKSNVCFFFHCIHLWLFNYVETARFRGEGKTCSKNPTRGNKKKLASLFILYIPALCSYNNLGFLASICCLYRWKFILAGGHYGNKFNRPVFHNVLLRGYEKEHTSNSMGINTFLSHIFPLCDHHKCLGNAASSGNSCSLLGILVCWVLKLSNCKKSRKGYCNGTFKLLNRYISLSRSNTWRSVYEFYT